MLNDVDKKELGSTNRQDLEERLIDFGILIIRVCEAMPRSQAGSHLSGQLMRSGTAPALNYAEAKAAESHRDFTHKIKVVLKELRGSWVNLRMTEGARILPDRTQLRSALTESCELVAIFTTAVKKAERRSSPRN